MEEGNVGFAGLVVGAVAENLDHNVGAENFGTIRKDLRALGGVVGVAIAGLDSRACFHDNFQTCFG